MTPIMYFEWRRQPNFGASNNHIQQPYPKEKLWIGHSWDLNVWHLRSCTNVLGHFCISGAFSYPHRPTPLPYHITIAGRVYPEFCIRWGGGGGIGGRGDCKKISKRMHCFMREPRMTEKSEYCITVLGTFIHNYTCFRRPITSLSSLVLISSYEVNGF